MFRRPMLLEERSKLLIVRKLLIQSNSVHGAQALIRPLEAGKLRRGCGSSLQNRHDSNNRNSSKMRTGFATFITRRFALKLFMMRGAAPRRRRDRAGMLFRRKSSHLIDNYMCDNHILLMRPACDDIYVDSRTDTRHMVCTRWCAHLSHLIRGEWNKHGVRGRTFRLSGS